MQLTNNFIYNKSLMLNSLFNNNEQYIPIKLNFIIRKNIQILYSCLDEINAGRQAIGEQYGIITEDGSFSIPPENVNTVNKELEDLLKRDMYEPEPSLGFEHDAFEEDDTPVLFGYFCDLPRIKRFDTAMNLKNMEGKIICFDFQNQ